MRRHPRLVNWLWRWHRRLGLAAALFVLLLAGSGILLNHTADLGLERRFIDWPLLHRLYGERDVERLEELLQLKEVLGVTLEELRIESYFPADDATAAACRGMAGDPAE